MRCLSFLLVTAAPLHALAQDERPVPPLPIAPRQAMARDHARALSEMADTAARDSAKCQSSGGRTRLTGFQKMPSVAGGQDENSKQRPARPRLRQHPGPIGHSNNLSVNVRFAPKSGHWDSATQCPLCATSRHFTGICANRSNSERLKILSVAFLQCHDRDHQG